MKGNNYFQSTNAEDEHLYEEASSKEAVTRNGSCNNLADQTSPYANLDPNKLVDAYGFGLYQMLCHFLGNGVSFFYSSALYVMPYVGASPTLECVYQNQSLPVDTSCLISSKGDLLHGKCGVVENTSLIIKEPSYSTTLIKEFGLSCSSFVWKEAGLTAFTVGAVTMMPVLTSMADSHGRRPLILLALTISITCHMLASIAPNYYIFIFLRFLIGAASDTYYSLAYVHSCEILPTSGRAWITVVDSIAWVLGMFWVGILSLVVKQWRMMYFACAAPGLATVAYYFFLPETPHWLIQHERYKEIENFVRIANNSCKRVDLLPDEKHESLAAVLRSLRMLELLIINGFLELMLAFYYFGLSFLSIDLSDDRFTAYMLSAFVELPGGLLVVPLMLYMGRRNICMSTMIMQGIAIIIAPLSQEPQWFLVAFVLLGKLINSITYEVHPIYISEMAPTSVRSLFHSIINVPQSIGIIIAPYLRHMDFGPKYTKYLIVGILCVISGASCIFLPETRDCPLPPDIKAASKYCFTHAKDKEKLMSKRQSEDTATLSEKESKSAE
ncbi:unnamed protein product [Cylicocyclus nassatus]|uniref:Major facilitator superfamily (MFS) profile domain-containing protein n=1 Tax=Cylicocyclus nassatus TaxID=53992 RepID=A0AA36H4H8_CYLNA|nr:unnamed protein product [Cylicocyclus nassatus]